MTTPEKEPAGLPEEPPIMSEGGCEVVSKKDYDAFRAHAVLLQREVERLQKERDGALGQCQAWMERHDNKSELLMKAERRAEELREDAERYRWLKANHLQTGTDSWIRTGEDLEEAIDAAKKEAKDA